MSLGFTAEQVWKDFVEDESKFETWIRLLERRKESKMLQQFRAYGIASGLLPDRRATIPRKAA